MVSNCTSQNGGHALFLHGCWSMFKKWRAITFHNIDAFYLQLACLFVFLCKKQCRRSHGRAQVAPCSTPSIRSVDSSTAALTQSLVEVMKLGISSFFLGGLVDELQRARFPNWLAYIVFRALLYCDFCKWLMIWWETETQAIFSEHIIKKSKIHMVSTSVLLLPWDGNHWWPITSSCLHVPVTNI